MKNSILAIRYSRPYGSKDNKFYLHTSEYPEETDLEKQMYYDDKNIKGDNYLGKIILDIPKELYNDFEKNYKYGTTLKMGEYPQNEVDKNTNRILEMAYKKVKSPEISKLTKLKEKYTLVSNKITETFDKNFESILADFKGEPYEKVPSYHVNQTYNKYSVYEYENHKYIRFLDKNTKEPKWIKVEPLEWTYEDHLFNDKNAISPYHLVSKKAFVCGALSEYAIKVDDRYLNHFISSRIKFSPNKTKKYLKRHVLNEMLRNNNLLKTILEEPKNEEVIVPYHNFVELYTIVNDNKGYKTFNRYSNIIFSGPGLDKNEMKQIEKLVNNNIKVSFVKSYQPENKTHSKFKPNQPNKKEVKVTTINKEEPLVKENNKIVNELYNFDSLSSRIVDAEKRRIR